MLFGRALDASLDDFGRRQARALAEHLASRHFAPVVHSSPRRRTRETAEIIAHAIDADVRTAAQIDEIDFGRWSGRSFRELDTDRSWREWNEHRDVASTPAGETIASVQARAMHLLHRLAAEQPAREVLLVTHSEIIRSIVMHCLGMPADCYDRIAIDPASITTVRLSLGTMRIEAMNERVPA